MALSTKQTYDVQKKYLDQKFGKTKRKNDENNAASLLEQHKNLTLAIDMMYVNRTITFMIMTSCTIHFGMAEIIKKWKNLPSFHSNK